MEGSEGVLVRVLVSKNCVGILEEAEPPFLTLSTSETTMSRAPSLRPIAAAALPYGTTTNSLRCAARPLAAQMFRQYATQPSRSKTMREMDRAARAGSSRMTKEQSISQLQKMANAEYFKDGGGPLFPGSHLIQAHLSLPCFLQETPHDSMLLWRRSSAREQNQSQ